MPTTSPTPLHLSIFGCKILIECADTEALGLLTAGFGHMAIQPFDTPDLTYTVGLSGSGSDFYISTPNKELLHAADSGEFMFLVEKELTIELERLRANLFFLHAAAVGYKDKAIILVAPSGSGKSTTAWALLHHGFTYLSDELAPIDLDTLTVHPYQHALCLKSDPPPSYPLPFAAIRTSSTIHVPVRNLPNDPVEQSLPLCAVFFMSYRPEANQPEIKPLSVGTSATRIVSNLLNGLAHTGAGLDGAIQIARACACFKLHTADLRKTCLAVHATIETLE